jgi:hypothetical protein
MNLETRKSPVPEIPKLHHLAHNFNLAIQNPDVNSPERLSTCGPRSVVDCDEMCEIGGVQAISPIMKRPS